MKFEISVIPLALIILFNSHLISCQRYGGGGGGTKGGQRPAPQQPVQRPIDGYGPSVQQQEEGPSYNQVEEGAADAEPPVYGGVPGAQPGVDFPGFTSLNDLPSSDFSCDSAPHSWGYYADQASQCQAFHICFDGRQSTMLCPVGTVFDQELLTCNYWNQVDCSQAPNFYSVNAELGKASGEPASGGAAAPGGGSGGRGGSGPASPSAAGRGGGYGPSPAAPQTPSRAGPASFQPQVSQDVDDDGYGQAPAPAPAPAPRPYQPPAPAPRPPARAPAPAPARPSFTPQFTQQSDEDSYGPPPAPAPAPAPQPPVKRPVRPRATQSQPPSQQSSYRPPAPSQARQPAPAPRPSTSYGGGKGSGSRQSAVSSQLNAADDDYNWSSSNNYYDSEPYHFLSYYRNYY